MNGVRQAAIQIGRRLDGRMDDIFNDSSDGRMGEVMGDQVRGHMGGWVRDMV